MLEKERGWILVLVLLLIEHTVFPLRSRLKYQLLADKVICVSRAVRETMIRGGMRESAAAVVYGGAVKPVQDPTANDRIRRELNLSSESKLLVAVGNLLDCKGHLDLVSAMPAVKQAQTHLVIAGEGQQRKNLEKKIAELRVQEIEAQIERRTLRSPIDGVVLEISKEEAESVTAPSSNSTVKPLVRVARIDRLRLVVHVPAALGGRLAAGADGRP